MPEPQKSGQDLSAKSTDMTVAIVVLLLVAGLFGVYFQDVIDWYNDFLGGFYSQSWSRLYAILAIIFSVLNLFLTVFIAVIFRRFARLKRMVSQGEARPVHVVAPKEEVRQNWEHIRELANSSNPSDWNMAVIRADALLDDILKHLGYEGESIAERLKIVDPTKLPSIDRVWSAHRLRNMIAHDPLEQHTRETIIHTLRSYEQALKELGMFEEEHFEDHK